MRSDEQKHLLSEMERLEVSIAEAQHTLAAFKTVTAYLAHRNGVKQKPVVEEPKLIEAPAKPPLICDGEYCAAFWDMGIRDAVEANSDKEFWHAISRTTAFPITYENGPSRNL